MGSVTALMMDVITEKSGHQMVGLAVSVCLTPAAPSPLPIPYPTFASVGEGVIDECLRTKIDGAKVLTVGSCTKNCHGNEPGTLKEVVSLNTTGPSFPILGAPIVFIELGMAGITLSPGFMNKNPIPGIGGSASGAGGGGSGAGGAGGGGGGPPGGNTQGPSNGGGGGGGSNSAAAPPAAPAPPGADGQATAGHPVDVITGALFTSPEIDFWLTGFLSFQFTRSYSTSAVRHRAGMGWGWSHALDYSVERSGDSLSVKLPGARVYTVAMPRGEQIVALPFGAKISCLGADLLIEGGDGLFRLLRSGDQRSYQLVEVRDLFGNFVEVIWDDGRIAEITDPEGRRAVWHVQGNSSFWELSVTDDQGKEHRRRAAMYELDSRGDLVRVIDAGGAETRYAYDEEHYLIRETLPDGLTYVFVHDASSGTKRCVETWGELPGRDILADIGAAGTFEPWVRGIYHVRIQYNDAYTTVVTNALGERHTYRGNALGLVEVYTDPRGYRHTYSYDETGSLVSVRDGAGRVRRRTYDAAGRRRTDALFDGNTWRTSFDDETQTLSLVRPDGEKHEFTYKGGVPVARKGVDGRVDSIGWDDKGRPTEFAWANGTSHKIENDAHGNPKKITTPDGTAFEYTFDLFGCPVGVKVPAGGRFEFEYDSRQDLVGIIDPKGKRTEIGIDACRRVIARRDAAGTTRFGYVARAQVELVRPDGKRWRFGYDPMLRLRWIENPAGERHLYDYDASGNIARETAFTGAITETEYDGSNYGVRTTRSDGSSVRYERDGMGRILKAEYSGGLTEEYQYDFAGRLTRARNATSMVTFERDALGRITREVQETGGYAFAVKLAYDDSGYVSSRKYSSGWSVQAKRVPGTGALLSLSAEASERESIVFSYDKNGLETDRRRESGTGKVAWKRDVYGLPESIGIFDAKDEEIRTRTYSWNAIGPVDRITDSRHGERRIDLDPEGRPLAARGLGVHERFNIAPQGTPVDASDTTAALGPDGRPTMSAGQHLEWDGRGRLRFRRGPSAHETWEYRYDDRDRLTDAIRGDGYHVRYIYDPLSRNIARLTNTGQSTWFGWDDEAIVEEKTSGGQSTERVFADDRCTPILESRNGRDFRMVVTDAAATPWAYIHGDGQLSELELSTWGKVVRENGDPGVVRFAGQRVDSDTGLHYNRHRYYDPRLSVFLTPDPLGVLTSPQSIGFVRNVTVFIDPSGLTTIVVGAPGDAVIQGHLAEWKKAYPTANVIHANDLKPNSLAGENHVVVTTHGAPNVLEWGDGSYANGAQVGQALRNAGFKGGPGSKVEVGACNSATPPQGGGLSSAQAIANATNSPTSGAASGDPAATYAGTTEQAHGGTWGPGMMAPAVGGGTPYVHKGSWTTVQPTP